MENCGQTRMNLPSILSLVDTKNLILTGHSGYDQFTEVIGRAFFTRSQRARVGWSNGGRELLLAKRLDTVRAVFPGSMRTGEDC